MDHKVCLLKCALISLNQLGYFDSKLFKERITSVCFDSLNRFIFIGTSTGSLITLDSKSGKLMGAQRIFKYVKVLELVLEPSRNLLIAVSEEIYKILKIGHVGFSNQKMNVLGFKKFGFFE